MWLVAGALLLYALAIAGTQWVFIADAPDYAMGVAAARASGDVRGLMEFGHPLWRPLGYAFAHETGTTAPGPSHIHPWLRVLSFMNGVALVMGGVAAACAAGWLRSRLDPGAVVFAVLWLLGAKAFLNYSHVGTSYVPALGCLLAGLFVASLEPGAAGWRTARNLSAGFLYGASALFWTPFGLVLPGAVLAPLFLRPDWRRELSHVIVTAVAGIATLALAFGLVGVWLGFAEVKDLRSWVASASGGRTFGGLARAVIGIPRSLVDLGDFGRLAKRYLLKDPLCPTSAKDLLGLDLLKMLGIYAGLLAGALAAWRTARGRRSLLLAAALAAPLLAFAVLWQGGDLERYLPAAPALLLVMATGFQEARERTWLKGLLLASLAMMALTNLSVLSNGAIRRRQDAALARLPASTSVAAPRKVFVVSHPQDELFQFHRTYPMHPRNLGGLRVIDVFAPGLASSSGWRSRIDRLVASERESGGAVFVSSRLLAGTPEPEWDWIEGDDPRAAWLELHEHFARFDYERPGRPGEEFLLLRPGGELRAAPSGPTPSPRPPSSP
ncbi:MAG: hypothetical protein IPN03_13825 [Holophagales bacterium]|nr:hypothetical protein [Holophagales bacterium]